MSYRVLRYLYCDGDNCPLGGGALFHAPPVGETITEQRRRAAEDGWRRVGPLDYCPECYESMIASSDGN